MKKKIWKRTMQLIGLGVICLLAMFSYKGNKSQSMKFTPTLQGDTLEKSLGKCGEKPNCVSSFHPVSKIHFIQHHKSLSNPLGKADSFFKDCKIKVNKQMYRHYECTSKMFKFVDDVELLYLPNEKELHFRSASRVGHSDLGANRDRINGLVNHLK